MTILVRWGGNDKNNKELIYTASAAIRDINKDSRCRDDNFIVYYYGR